RKLYVANTSGSTVSVIDLATRQVTKEIPVGLHPHGLGVLPDQSRLFVSVESDNTVKVVDTRSDTITRTISMTGQPNQLAVTPDDRRLFVALYGLHGFAWADLTTGKQVARVERPLPPPDQRSKFAYMDTHGLDLRPGDRELWVTSFIGNGLMIYYVTATTPR